MRRSAQRPATTSATPRCTTSPTSIRAAVDAARRYGRQPPRTRMTRWGIFGRVNVCTHVWRDPRRPLEHDHDRRTAAHHRSEPRQQGRLGHRRAGHALYHRRDGRRSGTTFQFVASPDEGKLMNNGFFGLARQRPPRRRNFGLADGSVSFVATRSTPTSSPCWAAWPTACRLSYPNETRNP